MKSGVGVQRDKKMSGSEIDVIVFTKCVLSLWLGYAIWFPKLTKGSQVDLVQGNTMIIPTGWIHAVVRSFSVLSRVAQPKTDYRLSLILSTLLSTL